MRQKTSTGYKQIKSERIQIDEIVESNWCNKILVWYKTTKKSQKELCAVITFKNLFYTISLIYIVVGSRFNAKKNNHINSKSSFITITKLYRLLQCCVQWVSSVYVIKRHVNQINIFLSFCIHFTNPSGAHNIFFFHRVQITYKDFNKIMLNYRFFSCVLISSL